MLLTSQNTYNQPLAEPQRGIHHQKLVHSLPHTSIHPKTPFYNPETQPAIPPSSTIIAESSTTFQPSNTHPHSTYIPCRASKHPKSILHHQNNPETIITQSSASKGNETDSLNCLALHSELLNNFRCILSYISVSNSCNLCFSLSMIG